MSGDVQPRKRNKDKRKRKEDEDVIKEKSTPSGVHSTKMGPDDIQLHVQSDHGTGGHWCAKIVFFSLMAVLLGLIGLILLENRGLADLDTPLSESRFADVLEGWVDEKREVHDEHDTEHAVEGHDDDEDDEHEPYSVEEDTHDEKLDDGDEHDEEDEGIENDQEESENSDENTNIDDQDEENQEEEDDDDDNNEYTNHSNEQKGKNDEDEDKGFEEGSDERNDEENDDNEANDDDDNANEDNDNEDDDNDDNDDDDEGEDKDDSIEEVVDNDVGEDLHLEKLAEQDKNDDNNDDEEDGSSSQIDTNEPTEDPTIEDELRKANERLQDDPKGAISLFETILQTHPNSLGAVFGKAKAMDRLSQLNRSNAQLKYAIKQYENYLEFGQRLNDSHFKEFSGEHLTAVPIHEKLIERFDDDPYYRNQLAVTYLLINRLADAKYVLHTTLHRWRYDGFAAVHYGFVLKNLDKDFSTAVIFLRQGIESGAEGTQDGRFYFALGDALMRLGQNDEAQEVYNQGAKKKLFLSPYQRSLYNVDRLKSKPFWTLTESGYKQELRTLQDNWKRIRDEGLSVLNEAGYFVDESENLRDFGDWKQFELFARGQKNGKNCARTPFTCKIIDTFPAARFCRRGQVKFSVMHPNTHVWPHCGPTNCRLRAHLGLKVVDKTLLRVVNETKAWEEGKIFIFDDSFEHEVWHNGTSFRLILIVDVWHPDLTQHERQTLSPI